MKIFNAEKKTITEPLTALYATPTAIAFVTLMNLESFVMNLVVVFCVLCFKGIPCFTT